MPQVTAPPPATNTSASRTPSSAEAPATPATVATLPFPVTGPISSGPGGRLVVLAVGLMWQASADIDLYVRPTATGKELCYFRTLTPQGRYVFDHQRANRSADYEWTEIWDDVNPDEVEVWANYFAGSGPVTGTVCVYFKGRTCLSNFSLSATSGNGGVNSPRRTSNPHWAKINLTAVLNKTN
jgi:hypothetical protein